MAIAGLSFSCSRSHFPFRHPSHHIYCVRKVRRNSLAAVETLAEPNRSFKVKGDELSISHGGGRDKKNNGDVKTLDWKKLSSKELGVSTSMISKPTRVVLNGLKKEGYEVYLVGGCVRDLILKRIPKDFDIITTAELKEVVRTFARCQIVGRRFPICHVHVDDTIVEVSSFSTFSRKSRTNSSNEAVSPFDCNEYDLRRWRNCLRRDFTINGLMFDPYAKVIYDYVGGIKDLRKSKVRTVIPAQTSFEEDCARILRAVRIAARLGFRFTRETACSVKDLSSSILRLDKGRLLMEMNYMLAFGSAEASLRLLWKIGLLEILLPIQAAYFVSQGFRRRDERSNMLLSLFSNLDKLLAPDRPCHASLWILILAFHQALVDHPKDPIVVAAFSLAVHNGGDLLEAVNISRMISKPHDSSLSELEPQELKSDKALINEVMNLEASVKNALKMMMDERFVSLAMAAYPQAPNSDLVFISLTLFLRANKIFECVRGGKEKGFSSKAGKGINYEYLALGYLREVRHAFARVVFDTVYPPHLNRKQNS